jgi:lipopolysaccharide heptosyltransferase III
VAIVVSRRSLKRYFEGRPPSSIVVVRTDRVGDLILSTPFLATLRHHFPKAHITAWVARYCEPVLAGSSLVDRVVTELPSGYFDLAIGLAPRSLCLKQVLSTQAPVRVGYVYKGRPLVRLLAHRCLTDLETVLVKPPQHVEHEVEHLDRLARRLGMPGITDHRLQLTGKKGRTHDWLVLHLGDRWFTNGWTTDDLVRLCYGLEAFGRLVVTAGPREAELVRGGGFEEFDLRSSLSFKEWCELISGARVLVSPDTGAVHVAAALDTPVVVAYEEDTFEHCSVQWRPWMVEHRALVKGSPDPTIDAVFQGVRELLRLDSYQRPS